MKAYVRTLSLALATAAVVASCGTNPGGGEQTGTSAVSGEQRPAADNASVAEELRFTAKTIEGAEFSGESLAGKPAVLWFWAPWCPVCQREAPDVAEAARTHQDISFVGVAAQDEVPAMREFADTYKIGSFTNLADTEAAVWQRFGITAQPAFAFISADGAVEVVKGTLSAEDLTARLRQLTDQ